METLLKKFNTIKDHQKQILFVIWVFSTGFFIFFYPECFCSTLILILFPIGLSFSSAACLALAFGSIRLPHFWRWIETLLSLWMVLPSLMIVLILADSLGVLLGLQGTCIVIAFSQFPMVFKEFLCLVHTYQNSCQDLVNLSHIPLKKKIIHVYLPFIKETVHPQLYFYACQCLWSFSVPLLLCSGTEHPLTNKLFLQIFEHQQYLSGFFLLSYGVLSSYIITSFKNSSSFNEDYIYKKQPPKHKKSFTRFVLTYSAWTALAFFLLPMFVYMYHLSADFSESTWPQDFAYTISFSFFLAATLSAFFIVLCVTLLIFFPRIFSFITKISLAFPRFFWAMTIGFLLLPFENTMWLSPLIYSVLVVFLLLPYGGTVLQPIITRTYKSMGSLLGLSHISSLKQLLYFWIPLVKAPVYRLFFYGMCFVIGDVTLYLCLAPFQHATLSLELYERLMAFDLQGARQVSLWIFLSIFICYPRKKNYA